MDDRNPRRCGGKFLSVAAFFSFVIGVALVVIGGQTISGIWAGNVAGEESRISDDAFRIDIRTITVRLTYHPDGARVDGEAFLTFTMRPGQSRPLIHFDPAVRGETVPTIRLDGEVLPFGDSSAVKIVTFTGSTQKAIEFQRDLLPEATHWLEMSYTLLLPSDYPRFSTEVSDYYGCGNEEIFPTLNTPHEMARHEITLVVDGPTPYRCLASGLVRKIAAAPQTWLLETEKTISRWLKNARCLFTRHLTMKPSLQPMQANSPACLPVTLTPV